MDVFPVDKLLLTPPCPATDDQAPRAPRGVPQGLQGRTPTEGPRDTYLCFTLGPYSRPVLWPVPKPLSLSPPSQTLPSSPYNRQPWTSPGSFLGSSPLALPRLPTTSKRPKKKKKHKPQHPRQRKTGVCWLSMCAWAGYARGCVCSGWGVLGLGVFGRLRCHIVKPWWSSGAARAEQHDLSQMQHSTLQKKKIAAVISRFLFFLLSFGWPGG